jgi:hypothetical protein
METVLCAARRIGNKVCVEVFDTAKDFAWVQESLKTMKTPNGDDLKVCPFHSGFPGDYEDGSNAQRCAYYAENAAPRPHSIWVKGGNCYDTCHIMENKLKESVDKERRVCHKILETYPTREQNVMKSHKEFFVNLDYLENLKNSIPLLEKEIELRKKPVNLSHPEYKTLEQLRDMAANLVKQKAIPHRRVYENSDKKISFEEYLKNNCPEVEALARAEEKLENWVNSHTPPPPADLISKKEKALNEISSVSVMLEKQWKLPYAMIWMLRNDIQRAIYSFNSEKEMYGYERDRLYTDIKYFDNYLGCYHSFMKGKNPIDIVQEVDKEQTRAIRLEKEQKNAKSIQKIESSSAFVPVVRLDGTTSYQSTADTYIANAAAATAPNENWRAVSRLGKFEVVKPVEDESKWERLR